MALSWLPKQDPEVLTACAASGKAFHSFSDALFEAEIAEIVGEDQKPDWYLRIPSAIDMHFKELRHCYRKTALMTPQPEVHSLYRSLIPGGDQVDCIYLKTIRLQNDKAVDPVSLPRLLYLSALGTFCEFEVPQSLPRDSRHLAYPSGYRQRNKFLFLLYLSQEERGLRLAGYTLGDRLKLPGWHSDMFMCARLQLATNMALLYVQHHVIMSEDGFFPNLETLVCVLPQSMHEPIKTDMSGKLEGRLCWKIPLGELPNGDCNIRVSHRLAQEIAVLYAVLTGKDLLQGRCATHEELTELYLDLVDEIESTSPDAPGELSHSMRRLMLDALISSRVSIAEDEELAIKKHFHTTLLLKTIEAEELVERLRTAEESSLETRPDYR